MRKKPKAYRAAASARSRIRRAAFAAGMQEGKKQAVDYAGPVSWLVVRKRETEPVEVTPFENEAPARIFFELAREHWSDTYLCRVVAGPRV